KLGLAALATMAATGLLSVTVSWWARPVDKAIAAGHGSEYFSMPRIAPLIFGARGIVPMGYVAFALALGVALGLVLRRSVAALALTLAAVVALQIAMPLFVREHLATPVKVV